MTSCHTSTSTVATLTTTTSTIMAPKMTLSSTMSSSLVTQTTTSVIPITAAKSTGGFQRLTSPNKLLKKLFSTPPTSPVVNIRDPVVEKESVETVNGEINKAVYNGSKSVQNPETVTVTANEAVKAVAEFNNSAGDKDSGANKDCDNEVFIQPSLKPAPASVKTPYKTSTVVKFTAGNKTPTITHQAKTLNDGKNNELSAGVSVPVVASKNDNEVLGTTKTHHESILLELQANFNLQLQRQEEGFKEQLNILTERLPAANWCADIAKSMQDTAENTSKLWAHCLEDRENIESLNKKQITLSNKVIKLQKRNTEQDQGYENLSSDVTGLLRSTSEQQEVVKENFASIQNAIRIIEGDLATMKQTVAPKEQLQKLQADLSEARSVIDQLSRGSHSRGSQSPVTDPVEHRERCYEQENISGPNLMLVDSNGRKVDENRLGVDDCKKIYTPTWDDIKKMLTQAQCDNPDRLERIFIHVGTNNFDLQDSIGVTNIMEEGFQLLKGKFPNAEITMCTIIPRKDDNKKEEIKLVNEFLHGSKRRLGINVIDLGAIHSTMCYDEKHINHSGIRILINATKFALTGLFPAEDTYNNTNRNNGRGRGNGRGNRRRGR